MPNPTVPPLQPPPAGEQIKWGSPLTSELRGFWPMTEVDGRSAKDLARRWNAVLSTDSTPVVRTLIEGIPSLEFAVSTARRAVAPSADAPSWSPQWTVAALVRPTAYNANFARVVESSPASGGFSVEFDSGSGAGLQRLYGVVWNGTTPAQLYPSAVTPLNQWQHVALTYDGTQARLFINGKLVSGPTTATNTAPTFLMRIGNYSDSSTNTFAGQIGPVGYWARALSAKEVALLAADPYAPLRGVTYGAVPVGDGAPSLGELMVAGEGAIPLSASGDVVLGELEAVGSDITHTATGDPLLEELTATGAALLEQTASGSPVLDELTASGAAVQTQTVSGASTLPQLVAAGSAGRVVIASGATTLGELTAFGTQGTVGAATLGLLEASGAAVLSTPPVTGDTSPPASPGNFGGADACLPVDFGIYDPETGTLTLCPVAPVSLRLKRRRRIIHHLPSGYARATTLPGIEAVLQFGEAALPVDDMAALREFFAARVNVLRWMDPDGTVFTVRMRRDSFKTRWGWAAPGFYDPLVLTFEEVPSA